MLKEVSVLLLLCLALASSEPRRQQRPGTANKFDHKFRSQPYLLLRVMGRHIGTIPNGLEKDEDYNDSYVQWDGHYENHMHLNQQDVQPGAPNFTVISDENEAEEDDDEDFADNENKIPIDKPKMFKPLFMSKKEYRDDLEIPELQDTLYHKIISIVHPMMFPHDRFPIKSLQLEPYSLTSPETREMSLMVPRAVYEDARDDGILSSMDRSFQDSQARAMQVILRRRRRNGLRRIGFTGNPNTPLLNVRNAQRRFQPNKKLRVIRQYVYRRPSVQRTTRRRQGNNRRRVNII